MLEIINLFENQLSDFHVILPLMVLVVCILAGIAVSKVVFSQLRGTVARISGEFYPMVKRAFRGMPTLWGGILGAYTAIHLTTLQPTVLHIMETLSHSLLILSLTIMGARLVSEILTFQLQKTAGNFASTSIMVTTIELVVYITGFIFLLQSFGVSVTPLLTALGVGGLAVALALQDTLSNLFSGINILLSKQTKVGDYIRLSTGEEGFVADMNWRSTTIQQQSNNMVVVPNQKIATSIITNYALPDTECSLVIPASVSYDSDLVFVETVTLEVAKQVLQEIEGTVKDFSPLIRYNAFADSSIQFNVILRVQNVIDQSFIRHEFIKRLHARYRQEGITIPFPTRTVNISNSNN